MLQTSEGKRDLKEYRLHLPKNTYVDFKLKSWCLL